MAYDSIKSPMDWPCPDPKSMPTGSRETVGIEGNGQGTQINSPLEGGWPGASPGSRPSEIPVITKTNIPGHPDNKPSDAIVTGQAVHGKG
jgi:hypothetical protein